MESARSEHRKGRGLVQTVEAFEFHPGAIEAGFPVRENASSKQAEIHVCLGKCLD